MNTNDAEYECQEARPHTTGDRSILDALRGYPLSDDIKHKADWVFNQMESRVHRGRKRIQLLFYCTYCAYRELGRFVIPAKLGRLFGLTPVEVCECDSIFSYIQTGYQPPRTNASPLEYLPEYCEDYHLSSELTSMIIDMSRFIIEKSPSLLQESPETVAGGLLSYCVTMCGIVTDDPKLLRTITGLSPATTETMYKRIAIIHNS